MVIILALAGVGNGLLDAAWNAWIGTMDHPNQLLGLLHGCYGLGGTLSPIIATSMITKGNLPWWSFFYLMIGLVTLELIAGTISFWSETGLKYRDTNRADGEEKGMTRMALKNKVTWICSIFFLAYVGTEGKSVAALTSLHHSPLAISRVCSLKEPSRSISRWLDCDFHAPCPPRSTISLWYDCNWLLVRAHVWPHLFGLRDP